MQQSQAKFAYTHTQAHIKRFFGRIALQLPRLSLFSLHFADLLPQQMQQRGLQHFDGADAAGAAAAAELEFDCISSTLQRTAPQISGIFYHECTSPD